MSKEKSKSSHNLGKIMIGLTSVVLIISLYLNGLTGRSEFGVKALRPWFGLMIFICVAITIISVVIYKKKSQCYGDVFISCRHTVVSSPKLHRLCNGKLLIFYAAEAQLGITDYTPTGTPANAPDKATQPLQPWNLLATSKDVGYSSLFKRP
ncbi:hypothetical protein IPM09_05485 [Candidatus Saccharibacteria bacterium]|nr:MAG: hypothetical protein IPM09_05485 [Candidatus Saccharibacteria bacterium]